MAIRFSRHREPSVSYEVVGASLIDTSFARTLRNSTGEVFDVSHLYEVAVTIVTYGPHGRQAGFRSELDHLREELAQRCPVCGARVRTVSVPIGATVSPPWVSCYMTCGCGLWAERTGERRQRRVTEEIVGYAVWREVISRHNLRVCGKLVLEDLRKRRDAWHRDALREARLLLDDPDAVEFHRAWGGQGDDIARLVFADWLEEKGLTIQMEAVRNAGRKT